MRLADYVAEYLVDKGVTDIFMLTGYGSMYLNDAIEVSGIRHFAARNEAAAPMMAEAYARVTQKIGVCCVTAGPGSTNAVPGLAEAYVDSAPILVISGQVEKRHTTYQANLKGLRTFGTAEINIIPIVEPLTKYAAFVDDPNKIRYHLDKAFYFALEGRPGPVWLDIPLDVQQAEINAGRLLEFLNVYRPMLPDVQEISKLFKELVQAKTPLIIAGQGIRQSGGIEAFRRLILKYDIPVLFSRLGQDILPHSYTNVFGQTGTKGSRYCKQIMQNADFVLALGCRLAVPLIGQNGEAFADNAKIAMVDIEAAELKKPGLRIDHPILGDVKLFMQHLNHLGSLHKLPDWSDWLDYCHKARANHPIITEEREVNPIDLYYFMNRLDEMSDKNHIFITDAGSNYYAGGQVWRFERLQREVCSGCNAAMGTTIPLAIGAAIASPESQILAVTGDGSLELNVQELKTISHYNLNIKLFVINNGGYASMRKWQDDFFDGRRIDTEEKTGIGTLDLQAVAKAFNLKTMLIDDYRSIDSQLQEIMSNDQPLFVEVMTDNSQRVIEAFEEVKEKVNE
jgi:acetolactate synthase-1/2/3 large subunit